jgi:outer membrane protein assembly factor BamB
MKKKVLFCYFGTEVGHYTPIDIGYIISILKKNFSLVDEYDFEIIQLNYNTSQDVRDCSLDKEKIIIENDVDLIDYHNPDAIFIFLENVLWSKVFAFGRAKKIAKEIRDRQLKIFIGIQSYKINSEQKTQILQEIGVDCVIGGNPETTFLYLDTIFKKIFVPGVEYQKNIFPKEGIVKIIESFTKKTCESVESLDDIPSPYLNHVFDNFIQLHQEKTNNSFRAFLTSSRGCGFGCYYCFRSTKFEKVRYFSVKRFYDEIEYLFTFFKVNNFFILDDSFLCSKERLRDFQDEFSGRLEKNPNLKIITITLMARPEELNEGVVKILNKLNVKTIQIGLQTVNPALQHYMRRTVDILYFDKIKKWLSEYGIDLYLDVVVGLPGDSVKYLIETMNYALQLEPVFLQVKQFYLNPDTLFYFNRSSYGIEIDNEETDFNAPYVIRAKNIDSNYFKESDNFIIKKIEENPNINWRYLTKKNKFLSINSLFLKKNIQKNTKINAHYYNILWVLGKNSKIKKGGNLNQLSPQIVTDSMNTYVFFEDFFYAIRQSNGKVSWGLKVQYIGFEKRFTPRFFTSNSKLYFGSQDGNIYCFDSKTGKRVWVSLEGDYGGSFLEVSLKHELLFVALDIGFLKKKNVIVALDIKTGFKKWEYLTDTVIFSSFLYVDKKELIVASNNNGDICVLNADTGKIKWSTHIKSGLKISPIFDSGTSCLLVVSCKGVLYTLNINNGKFCFSLKTDITSFPTPIFYKDFFIFIDSDMFLCSVNLKTKNIVWKFFLNDAIQSDLIVIYNSLFFQANNFIIFEIDLDTGKLRSSLCDIKEKISCICYDFVSKKFFISTYYGSLYCLSRQTCIHFFNS